MPERLTLIVQLHLDPSRASEYEQFETQAARIMARHGGRIERRVSLSGGNAGPDTDRPDELHVVTFPSERDFERYREDAQLTPLASLRALAIRRTEVWRGTDLPGFA